VWLRDIANHTPWRAGHYQRWQTAVHCTQPEPSRLLASVSEDTRKAQTLKKGPALRVHPKAQKAGPKASLKIPMNGII
jgi:hypothetical protein